MKYFNLLFSCFIFFVSFKGNSQNKNTLDSNKVSSYENDKKLLNEKLAYTNKIWDSLSYILRQRPKDTIYRNSVRIQFKENKDKQLFVYQNFISENPNSLLSAETLTNLKFLYGKRLTQKLFEPMPEKIKNSQVGIDISNFIQLYQNPKINEKYIDFELVNQNGEKIKLSEHLGKYILIDFWASWCAPCRKSNIELVKIYETNKNKGLIIIGVSIDDEKKSWTQAIEKDGLTWINVSDLKGKENTAAIKYGVTGVPTNFLINAKGIIIAKDIDLETLKEIIK
ncbi:peroxiredoxin family protein [Mariniflexile gromovii]|uniref:TlpA family protein disulfide reductase n=1 Tax=Mariniflexile gromovii TaxID=362523 RepID=A0ABS4BS81_9FLAO|nr:TlpA disulfide reductase family protein [Mariniflexile gromovii]MBP0903440.1 TlpA family protein disulfide reductase [Mariniflexile gromovii]